MSANNNDKAPSSQTRKIKIKYDELSARYANQVVLNGSAEEIYLDFSSGAIPDPNTGESVIPIHTRIAMTHAAARRLLGALQQTLSRTQAAVDAKREAAVSASLPPLQN